MARITSYPVLSTVSSEDWIPITDTSVAGNPLKNITVGSLEAFIISNIPVVPPPPDPTLQSVITAGNTYQGSGGPFWTWNGGSSGLVATSGSLSTSMSERFFRAANLSTGSYIDVESEYITLVKSNGFSTEINPNKVLASNVTLQLPLADGVIALVSDIPASPWVPVTGGINYPTNKVGINTALPQEVLDVTGNALFSGNVTATRLFGNLDGVISTTTVGTTQVSTDNSTKIATTAFVANAVGAIPSGLTFQGEWDAATNTPNIGASTPDNGDFYIVSVAGTTNLGGITDWEVGDWAIAVVSGGVTTWQKIDNSSVLTGQGAGTKIAKWDGAGTSVTLTDSIITENGANVIIGGDLESTGFIKTGGTATEFLMADGNVTTGAFTGNIPDGQITFGNASSNGITSSANLEFDDTFKVLTVKGTSVGYALIRDDNVLVIKDATTAVGINITTIPRVQFTQGGTATYLQLLSTPSQENTISLPDKSGTITLLDDISVPAGKIAFGNAGSDGLTSNSSFSFNDSTKELFVGGTSAFGSAKITEEQVQIQFDAQLSAALALRNDIPEVRFTKGNINTYLQVATTPTQQNFISLPDKSGTIALLDDVSSGSVTGTGGAGYIPLWADATALTDSAVFQDGTSVGIGTINPAAQLETTENILVKGMTVGVGEYAVPSWVTGGITVVGVDALPTTTGGVRSTAIGHSTLKSITSGSSNTAIGSQAMEFSTVVTNATAVGAFALQDGIGAYSSVAIGAEALRYSTLGTGTVALGSSAGKKDSTNANNTRADQSVFIGTDTKPLGINQTQQIVIGSGAVGLGSNTAVLGSATITKTRLHGNVGIGTDTPASSLDVASGDVEVSQIASGIILKSPDGTRYRVTVANGGTLTVTAV